MALSLSLIMTLFIHRRDERMYCRCVCFRFEPFSSHNLNLDAQVYLAVKAWGLRLLNQTAISLGLAAICMAPEPRYISAAMFQYSLSSTLGNICAPRLTRTSMLFTRLVHQYVWVLYRGVWATNSDAWALRAHIQSHDMPYRWWL